MYWHAKWLEFDFPFNWTFLTESSSSRCFGGCSSLTPSQREDRQTTSPAALAAASQYRSTSNWAHEAPATSRTGSSGLEMSSGWTSDNVATHTFNYLISDSNGASLALSSSIPACVSNISGELAKFAYGHSTSEFFRYLTIPDASKQPKQVLQYLRCHIGADALCAFATSMWFRSDAGTNGLLAALAMPPAIGSWFKVRGSPNHRPHRYYILHFSHVWLWIHIWPLSVLISICVKARLRQLPVTKNEKDLATILATS